MIEYTISLLVGVAIIVSTILPVVGLVFLTVTTKHKWSRFILLIGGILYPFVLVGVVAELDRRDVTVASIVSEIYSSEEKK